jgi:hypothetical protein
MISAMPALHSRFDLSATRVLLTALVCAVMMGAPSVTAAQDAAAPAPTIAMAQRAFYDGNYAEAAAATLALQTAEPDNLVVAELRTSALLFQLKRLLDTAADKKKAFAECATCPALLTAFGQERSRGVALAQARLAANPGDDTATFFLGKLNLNHVWLHLGTLGRRTGWNEYWEARRSLDALLARQPQHVRGRVARAWIDYIVDTKMTRGFRWILGGGNKERALRVVREAAAHADAEPFASAEARFALWDLQVREKDIANAVVTATALARDFPANKELAKFLQTHR